LLTNSSRRENHNPFKVRQMARYARQQRRDNLTFVQASAIPAFGGRKLTSEGRVFFSL